MKGQRLFVRPIDDGDHAKVTAFLAAHAPGVTAPANGLLGRLVGELVAVLAMELGDDAIHIRHLVVTTELRRKRIGRVMLMELEQLALKLERTQLVVDDIGEADEGSAFFRRVGFEWQNDGSDRRLVRELKKS